MSVDTAPTWGHISAWFAILALLFAGTCTAFGGLRPVPRVVEVDDAR